MYAYRFIQLVKAKTPKVTYYSTEARCLLMESIEDFEMFFYNGGKIIRSYTDQIKIADIIDENSKSFMMKHFSECYQHCRTINQTLEEVKVLENACFPVIIGRKPKRKEVIYDNISEYSTPKVMSVSICFKL